MSDTIPDSDPIFSLHDTIGTSAVDHALPATCSELWVHVTALSDGVRFVYDTDGSTPTAPVDPDTAVTTAKTFLVGGGQTLKIRNTDGITDVSLIGKVANNSVWIMGF